jgi:hypothetical protein
MKQDFISNDPIGAERHLKVIVAVSLVFLLAIPAFALIWSFQSGDDPDVEYINETGSPTGDMSMDSTSRDAWEDFLDTAPSLEFRFDGPNSKLETEELEIDDYLPDLNESGVEYQSNNGYDRNGDYSEPPPGMKTDDSDDDMALDSEAGGSAQEREVEESDIVKAIGNRLYVLNNYRGLMVVNLEDASNPYVEGSLQVLGYPVSMYVVDFLGFVIVSNAPTLDGDGSYSGMIYIIDLTDNSDPRIVKMVELNGYPVDSRRVGEVIYVVTNEHESNYYHDDVFMDAGMVLVDEMDDGYYKEKEPKTHVTSIGFYDPSEIGQRDRVEIDGSGGLVHASSFAIYIPQPNYDYNSPRTKFTYVDISDPKGDIMVRGEVTVPGLLMDRYQMDHYRGTFRVVTQKWPSGNRWDELPMSTLYVIDARDPDDMERVSKLLIDDSGNLMATRFAGDRAYTIHLPRTIDPLDVIDLSDPADPELTDILELPGWVEHMEVIGKDIIAVGVDDASDDGWKVALSLFDVNDPYNAVLDDRIIIGEGHTYSSANYDPKALTILESQGLVLIPFDSYDWRRYEGENHGVQVVEFDLEEGTLEEKGIIGSDDSIERSRWVNGAIVTMSQRMVTTAEMVPDGPNILGRVELASNIGDAFFSDGMLVSLMEPYWGETSAKIRISDPETPYLPIRELDLPELKYMQIDHEDNLVYVKGIGMNETGYPVCEIHLFDMEDPLVPVHIGPSIIPVPGSYYSYDYGGKYYLEDDEDSGNVSVVPGIDEEMIEIWYDPFSWNILEDGSVAVYLTHYDYHSSGYTSRTQVHLVYVSDDDLDVSSVVLDESEDYVSEIVGGSDGILIAMQEWWPPSTRIIKILNDGGSLEITGRYEVTGSFLGASEDLDRIYTQVTFRDDEEAYNKMNIFSIGEGITLLQSMDLQSPVSTGWFTGDSIVVVSQSWDYWYGPYHGYIRYDDDVAYAESDSSEGGQETTSSDEKGEEPEESKSEIPEGTKIMMISLDEGLFGDVVSLQLDSNAYVSHRSDEMVVLDSGMTHTVVSFTDGLEEEGSWYGNGWVQGGDIEGSLLVLAMGMYGVEVKDL